jgi:ABC-type Zn uptake system ZnuABC Zn-binding protein ZnuA
MTPKTKKVVFSRNYFHKKSGKEVMNRGMVVILKVVQMKVISMGQFEKGKKTYIKNMKYIRKMC